MPFEREMLLDRPEAREECLRAFRVAKAAHAALAFACRLVAVLGAIVEPGCRFDEHNGVDAPTLTALMCQSASVVFNHLNEVGASIMTVTTVGIDLAKNVFEPPRESWRLVGLS
jgi:hypothetical protein